MRPTDIVDLLHLEANATEELHPQDSEIEVMRDAATEIERLRTELGRAYRALHGLYHAHVNGYEPGMAMLAYHSLTLGAARRFITDESLEGASYFEGKKVEVLHTALAEYQRPTTPEKGA